MKFCVGDKVKYLPEDRCGYIEDIVYSESAAYYKVRLGEELATVLSSSNSLLPVNICSSTILQTKYCWGEEELNDFLKTLHFSEGKFPYLYRITYSTTVHTASKAEVLAVVEYFVEGE